MGHMLEHTEIDILMRWHRMRGKDVLWLPGTDHASIATQLIVEQEIGRQALPELEPGPSARATWRREGQRRRIKMGREKFLELCWKWKEQNGGTIRRQMERLGASCDWTRDRFTMDPAYSLAVQEVFVRLYREGLIYRGKYIVNWCPRCGTAVSDLEVIHEERPGHLWYIRYPFENGSGSISVATTRPETMLGDTAVAVNPADERYRSAVGRKLVLPLLKRVIPVIADDFVDPQFGTGAVKVTPAHDPNDYDMSLRHNLPRLEVIDTSAMMTEEAGPYRGMDRFEAREKVIQDLREQGLLEKTEDYPLSVGTCQRCKTVLEPLLSTQWFMKMQELAEPAIRVVEEGRIRITPENYRKIYLDWVRNIHDWCISRQLWWGHRIPVWYCDACGEVMVGHEAPPACPHCQGEKLRPELDVLDTWFSSALWPFATLGWPGDTPDLRRFYPNDLMIMGFDILFFWGARMIMMGMKFMNDVPFRELFIHGLVRDAEKQKMSKTKGNVIDPLEITEEYGTDAVRFALAISAAPGTDIAFSVDNVQSYRAFANKIWNAARFIFMNMERAPQGTLPNGVPQASAQALEDRWILSRFHRTAREVNEALDAYRFDEAAHRVYTFFWGDFCDWYIELSKLRLNAEEPEVVQAALRVLTTVFDGALRMLSPFMPFITEELWHALYGDKPPLKSIALAAFPEPDDERIDERLKSEMSVLQDLIVSVRQIRHDLKVEPKVSAPIRVFADDGVRRLIEENREAVERLANVSGITFVESELSKVASARHTARFDVVVEYEKKVDTAAERVRLEKDLAKMESEQANARRQLANEQFLAKAPEKVVEGLRKRAAELEVLLDKAKAGLGALK